MESLLLLNVDIAVLLVEYEAADEILVEELDVILGDDVIELKVDGDAEIDSVVISDCVGADVCVLVDDAEPDDVFVTIGDLEKLELGVIVLEDVTEFEFFGELVELFDEVIDDVIFELEVEDTEVEAVDELVIDTLDVELLLSDDELLELILGLALAETEEL